MTPDEQKLFVVNALNGAIASAAKSLQERPGVEPSLLKVTEFLLALTNAYTAALTGDPGEVDKALAEAKARMVFLTSGLFNERL